MDHNRTDSLHGIHRTTIVALSLLIPEISAALNATTTQLGQLNTAFSINDDTSWNRSQLIGMQRII